MKGTHVHFVGIGGIGMSALARFLLGSGYQVSGSDREPGEQGQALASLGARVLSGHQAEYLGDADLVVVTSALPPDNPEVRAALERHIPVIKRAELLASIMNERCGVAVAGTHGKTTTTALIGHILTEAGLDPTILVGGISADLGSNARVGQSEIVVAEADEYDASFLRLTPEVAVITNVESDHLDFYGTVEKLHQAFQDFARAVKGTLVVCADDFVLLELVRDTPARVLTYGKERGDWLVTRIHQQGEISAFTVAHGQSRRDYTIRLPGEHNVLNAVAAIAVGATLGVPHEEVLRSVATFRGVARRLERKGEALGVLVMDDYAHHPTEIRASLAAIKERFGRPLHVVFQPHTYSRTHALLDDFAAAFRQADYVYLLDIYAARETNTLGISSHDLALATSRHHPHVTYSETIDAAVEVLVQETQPGDIVVTMGAGDVYRLGLKLLEGLQQP